MMAWYPKLVLYLGLFDASLIMVGGLVVATYTLMGWKTGDIVERMGMALLILIGSNVAAALVLGATKWLIG